MHTIPLSDITIGERQRQEFKPKEMRELTTSIQSKGLLQPIVLTSTHSLLAGERRLRAVKELHTLGFTIKHNGQDIPAGHIPYVYIHELSPADLLEAELEENMVRANLSWPEQVQAIAIIHKLRSEINPSHTLADTSRLLNAEPPLAVSTISRAVAVAQHLDDKDVMNAPNVTAAYSKVLQKAEQRIRAQLLSITSSDVSDRHTLKKGDLRTLLPQVPDKSVDLILCDPPYGVDMHRSNSSTIHHYDDSRLAGEELMKFILLEGFRCTKPRAAMFMFCDSKLFGWLYEAAIAALWTPWTQPLIWDKGPGPAPWGSAGFQRSYESIFFAVKGRKELVRPGGPDIIRVSRVNRAEKVHAAEKPVNLYSTLIDLACEPGDVVLDPCCGSGPVFPAADECHCRALGFEINPEYHQLAAARIQKMGDTNGSLPTL